MLSTEANFVKISAIFFSLACVAEVILPRLLDFKTVRIFAYSSKREQSNKKVWNEAENGEWDWGEMLRRFFFSRLTRPTGMWGSRASPLRLLRHALPISLLILWLFCSLLGYIKKSAKQRQDPCSGPPTDSMNYRKCVWNFLSFWSTNRQRLYWGGQNKDFWEMLFSCSWNIKLVFPW